MKTSMWGNQNKSLLSFILKIGRKKLILFDLAKPFQRKLRRKICEPNFLTTPDSKTCFRVHHRASSWRSLGDISQLIWRNKLAPERRTRRRGSGAVRHVDGYRALTSIHLLKARRGEREKSGVATQRDPRWTACSSCSGWARNGADRPNIGCSCARLTLVRSNRETKVNVLRSRGQRSYKLRAGAASRDRIGCIEFT
ncbi:unnamed protein product [Trichogramma brassicae]|uniref:Uncharacterized protein n=1 Tax=Trichogramma brassicae TaxID=86971 RepID=A0A6H5IGP4_9HYME|nr:unnamed protein product [Trichogramma brassicae]